MAARLAPMLALAALLAPLGACVDFHRGAVVQMNLARDGLPPSGEDAHYALYALVNGGPVEVERFKVLSSIDDCGASAQLTSEVRLVQRFDDADDSRANLCRGERRLGTLDTVNLAAGQLIGGVRIDTAIDLSGVERMLITREDDEAARLPAGERPPGPAVLVADIAPGVAPFEEACVDPPPEPRRGVLRGVWVRAPGTAPCAGRAGEIAVVPAEDETR